MIKADAHLLFFSSLSPKANSALIHDCHILIPDTALHKPLNTFIFRHNLSLNSCAKTFIRDQIRGVMFVLRIMSIKNCRIVWQEKNYTNHLELKVVRCPAILPVVVY